jgi:nitroimidazol reductase NimA-like FMN-containing flavoprotein (pyridoxamine 5'-phosphate oxidase superfamily)
MSPAEVDAFLRAGRKVQVAVNGHRGTPHLTTLFHVLDDEGRICFWTYATSQKVRNLERDDRITCLVEDGTDYFELRGVSVSGRAELLRDPGAVRAVGEAVACRMLGVEDVAALGEAGRQEVERQVAKRVAVVVHPERVASWDHARLLSR